MIAVLLSMAFAGDDARAKELYQTGAELYDNGRYSAAAEAWESAYDLSPRPLLLYNLSNVYERLADLDKARDRLTRYREVAPTSEHDTLDARLAALDGRIALDTKRREDERAAQEAREAELKARQDEAVARAEEAARRAEASRGSTSSVPVLPIAMTVTGAGLAGFGVVQGLGAAKARKTLRDPSVCADSGLCTTQAQVPEKQARRRALAADVSIGAGLALAGAGTFLLIRKRPSGDLWAHPSPTGLTLGGSWGGR